MNGPNQVPNPGIKCDRIASEINAALAAIEAAPVTDLTRIEDDVWDVISYLGDIAGHSIEQRNERLVAWREQYMGGTALRGSQRTGLTREQQGKIVGG